MSSFPLRLCGGKVHRDKKRRLSLIEVIVRQILPHPPVPILCQRIRRKIQNRSGIRVNARPQECGAESRFPIPPPKPRRQSPRPTTRRIPTLVARRPQIPPKLQCRETAIFHTRAPHDPRSDRLRHLAHGRCCTPCGAATAAADRRRDRCPGPRPWPCRPAPEPRRCAPTRPSRSSQSGCRPPSNPGKPGSRRQSRSRSPETPTPVATRRRTRPARPGRGVGRLSTDTLAEIARERPAEEQCWP